MTDCVHHWLLADPAGGRVAGICRDCGEARTWVSFHAHDLREFNSLLPRDPILRRVTGPFGLPSYY